MSDHQYINPDTFLATIGDADDEGDAITALNAASRGIEMACDRIFYLADESNDEVRFYTPRMPLTLPIDDLVALTEVALDVNGDGTFLVVWTQGKEFLPEPLNAPAKSRPWEYLSVRTTVGQQWPVEITAGVRITGRFGWVETPAQILQAIGLLASKLLVRQKQAPLGFAVTMESAAYIAKTDPDIGWLLKGMKRVWIG